MPSLAAALKDRVGSEVVFNPTGVCVTRSDGVMTMKTEVQSLASSDLSWEVTGDQVGTLTINADLLEYCLQEVQATVSSANSDSLVTFSFSAGLEISVADPATGMSCNVKVPARSFKMEGNPSTLIFKAWVVLCMLRFSNHTASSSLLKLEIFPCGLRLVVKLPDSGDSRSELRLLSVS